VLLIPHFASSFHGAITLTFNYETSRYTKTTSRLVRITKFKMAEQAGNALLEGCRFVFVVTKSLPMSLAEQVRPTITELD
jgi:hypothetical protein